MSPHEAVDALAMELAKPVMQGHLTGSQAYATLALAALKLPGGEGLLSKTWDTLKASIAFQRDQKAIVRYKIAETLETLISAHRPKNVLLAEAHGINGATGFWLTEEEVTACTTTEVWRSLPEAPRRRRRG